MTIRKLIENNRKNNSENSENCNYYLKLPFSLYYLNYYTIYIIKYIDIKKIDAFLL